jgi:D-glycero-alpha-D-manno-heptose-7-phosphate kinase
VAYAAHSVETELLHQQCGIQDQLCAAFGGINYIEISVYPHATVSQLQIPDPLWWELDRRLCLVHLGRSHISSQIHSMVIEDLENASPEDPRIENLRRTAILAKEAIYSGNLADLGAAMVQNTEYQRELHPKLVCQEADQVSAVAREFGALGWKVNGAGGDGGSLTILTSREMSRKRAMIGAIEDLNPLFHHIPVSIARRGLRVWSSSELWDRSTNQDG